MHLQYAIESPRAYTFLLCISSYLPIAPLLLAIDALIDLAGASSTSQITLLRSLVEVNNNTSSDIRSSSCPTDLPKSRIMRL